MSIRSLHYANITKITNVTKRAFTVFTLKRGRPFGIISLWGDNFMTYIRLAVCFAAGIYLYERVSGAFALIFILSLFMVLTIQRLFKHKFNIKIFIAALSVVLGIVMCQYSACDSIKDLSPYKGRYVTLTGRISEIPETDSGKVQYVVDTKRAKHKNEEHKIKGKVLLSAQGGFRYGETLTFSGFIDTMPAVMNSDGFDFAKYYKSRGIFFKIYSSDASIAAEQIRDFSPYAVSVGIKNFVCDIIGEHYTGDYGAIMKAVLAGNKREFSEDYNKILTRTGTKRFFYPAFLHVMLFMSLITFAVGPLAKRKRDMLTVFLLILYAFANSSNAVFIKLCLIMSAFIFVKDCFGHLYYIDVLGAVAVIMGLINPLVYFDAAFVMSMLSSVLIHYFYDTVQRQFKFIGSKYLRRSLSIGLICTVGLIPITAYFFGSVTVYSILVSVVMLPCVAAIVIMSPLLVVLLALSGRAPIVSQVIRTLLFVIARIPVVIDRLPFSYTLLPKPSLLVLIIYALLLVAAVKYIKNKKKHMALALFTAAAFGVSVIYGQVSALNSIDITFVNVGQGDGALIQAPHRFNVLIDGGGGNAYSDYDPGEKVYLEYLKTKGVTKVDSAFVSHYHKDHVQGIIAAVKNIKVRNLFLPDNMEGSEWRVALEEAARERGTKIHYISQETLLTYKNGMKIKIVPPAAKTRISDDENDTTYVYYVEYGGFKTVFTGDMSEFAEQCLLETGKAEDIDLLKVTHHGSRSGTSGEWVRALSPSYAVISVGEDNTYALPNEEVLERLKDTELYRTDIDGDVRFTIEKNGNIKIKTLNGR